MICHFCLLRDLTGLIVSIQDVLSPDLWCLPVTHEITREEIPFHRLGCICHCKVFAQLPLVRLVLLCVLESLVPFSVTCVTLSSEESREALGSGMH